MEILPTSTSFSPTNSSTLSSDSYGTRRKYSREELFTIRNSMYKQIDSSVSLEETSIPIPNFIVVPKDLPPLFATLASFLKESGISLDDDLDKGPSESPAPSGFGEFDMHAQTMLHEKEFQLQLQQLKERQQKMGDTRDIMEVIAEEDALHSHSRHSHGYKSRFGGSERGGGGGGVKFAGSSSSSSGSGGAYSNKGGRVLLPPPGFANVSTEKDSNRRERYLNNKSLDAEPKVSVRSNRTDKKMDSFEGMIDRERIHQEHHEKMGGDINDPKIKEKLFRERDKKSTSSTEIAEDQNTLSSRDGVILSPPRRVFPSSQLQVGVSSSSTNFSENTATSAGNNAQQVLTMQHRATSVHIQRNEKQVVRDKERDKRSGSSPKEREFENARIRYQQKKPQMPATTGPNSASAASPTPASTSAPTPTTINFIDSLFATPGNTEQPIVSSFNWDDVADISVPTANTNSAVAPSISGSGSTSISSIPVTISVSAVETAQLEEGTGDESVVKVSSRGFRRWFSADEESSPQSQTSSLTEELTGAVVLKPISVEELFQSATKASSLSKSLSSSSPPSASISMNKNSSPTILTPTPSTTAPNHLNLLSLLQLSSSSTTATDGNREESFPRDRQQFESLVYHSKEPSQLQSQMFPSSSSSTIPIPVVAPTLTSTTPTAPMISSSPVRKSSVAFALQQRPPAHMRGSSTNQGSNNNIPVSSNANGGLDSADFITSLLSKTNTQSQSQLQPQPPQPQSQFYSQPQSQFHSSTSSGESSNLLHMLLSTNPNSATSSNSSNLSTTRTHTSSTVPTFGSGPTFGNTSPAPNINHTAEQLSGSGSVPGFSPQYLSQSHAYSQHQSHTHSPYTNTAHQTPIVQQQYYPPSTHTSNDSVQALFQQYQTFQNGSPIPRASHTALDSSQFQGKVNDEDNGKLEKWFGFSTLQGQLPPMPTTAHILSVQQLENQNGPLLQPYAK